MKFAVLKSGGKQYLVKEGDKIKIEKLVGDFSVGSKVSFDEVLMTTDGDTATFKKGGKIAGEVVAMGKHDKVEVIRYMPKSRWYKKNGHKQPYFEVKITSI